jgi:hypothetical protein
MSGTYIPPIYWLLFDRYAELKFIISETETLVLDKNNIDFDAQVSLDDSNNSNKATINIYNLPVEQKDKLVKDTVVTITAGYNDGPDSIKDQGIVFTGIIEKIKDTKENVTVKTEIQCSEANDTFQEIEFEITASKNTAVSTIIEKILNKINNTSKITKISKGVIKLGKDIKYERAKTFKNNLKNILGRLAIDSHSRFYISKQILYFYPESEAIKDTIYCENSKIISISDTDMGYSIKMFFDHRMEEGNAIILDIEKTRFFDEISANMDSYKITSVEHNINPIDGEHTTTIEIECASRAKIKEEKEKQKDSKNGNNILKLKI